MGLSFTAPAKRAAVLALCISAINACSDERDKALAANLETAEGMIDAFYSFDASRLRPFLSRAGEAQGRILGYQAWAEGGNYVVLERAPCAPEDDNTLACAITVRDDPVVALETGFNVTDTFHISFEDGIIVGVDTSSDDQPIYYEARQWVEDNLPAVMEGPCRRENGLRVTPGACARAMTEGYRQFMQAKKARGAAGSALVPAAVEPPAPVQPPDPGSSQAF